MKGGISNVFGNFEDTKNAKIAKSSIIHFRRTPAVVRSHTKSTEGQYETNKLLLDLSQRISLGITKDRNGNKISPTVPPKYITYKMLYNECLDNRQTPRITKVEVAKLKKTFKNDKEYPLLNNSIGVKILLNKSLYELERVKWWCDWYKMMKGRYTSGLSGLSGRVRSTSLRKAKTYGGVGARRFSPSMTPRERQERQERQNEERIQRQYRLLIPIRNGLLYAMRCFGNVAYSAATFIYWTTSLIMDSNDIDVIHDTNEEVRQEFARRQASEENARRQAQAQAKAQDEDNARRQAQAQEDLRRQRQEQYERNRRPPEYYEEKFANAQRNVREKSKGERKDMNEEIKQKIFEKELNDLLKSKEQAKAFQEDEEEYKRRQEAMRREDEIIYQELMYIMRELSGKKRAFTQKDYDDAVKERRRRIDAGIRIPWDTAQSPPRAATRGTQATQAAQSPPAIPQALPAMNDDSNLGTLEEWNAISKLKKWDDIKGIQSIIGNNNNTIASVMLFLYLRDLKDTDAKLTKGHFGYQSIDALIADFKRHIFNNSYASIGEDFFKIRDDGSNVYSISRITLLRQRLNRVFFFLARDKKSESYVGYKRSRGDGYDFANSIGITDEDFVKIIKNPAAFAKDKTNPTKSVKLVTGKGKSTFDDFAPEDITVDVVIPTKLYDVHRRILLKSHPDKGGSAEQKKRADSMFENFLKWYRSYKPTDLNEKEVPFYNVVQIVKWDKYNNGEYSDIAIKWFLD
jgi:hypothetical protein